MVDAEFLHLLRESPAINIFRKNKDNLVLLATILLERCALGITVNDEAHIYESYDKKG